MKGRVTDYDGLCVICGNQAECEHHLLFGTFGREFSEKFGLKVPMCNRCHNMGKNSECVHGGSLSETMSRIIGQLSYEKMKVAEGMSEREARKDFQSEFGSSFL